MRTTAAIVPDENEFDNILQAFANSRRPTDEASKVGIRERVRRLADACGNDRYRWKLFVLTLIHKRYHLLSPQAKEEAVKGDDENKKNTKGGKQQGQKRNRIGTKAPAGDGERLIFYTATQTLSEIACGSSSDDRGNEDDPSVEYAEAALRVLLRASPLAGGTRDVCTMIVDFVDAGLRTILGQDRAKMAAAGEKESTSSLVATGVGRLQEQEEKGCKDGDALGVLCRLAAEQLDKDLDIVRSGGPGGELTSTLHVFLPHRDRGGGNRKRNKDRKIPNRQLANTVAEVLIWSKTSRMDDPGRFASMYGELLRLAACCTTAECGGEATRKCLHAMQTVIRQHRKKLNRFARDRGQMLRDQFVLDPQGLDLSQIRRGKAGDLACLTKMAKKKGDTRVLGLISHRFLDPSKATEFGSISEMISSWVGEKEGTDDELAALQRGIFAARVRATALHLRESAAKETDHGPLLVASLDNSKANHIAAALFWVAFSGIQLLGGDRGKQGMTFATTVPMEICDEPRVRLLVGGGFKDISSFDSFLKLVDEIISGSAKNEVDAPTFMSGNIATTKAVLNLMDRHSEKGDASSEKLVLFSSGDIAVPSGVMKDLTSRGCSIHCHDADIIGDRLKREGAKRGDITVSLAWDTFDDLDLHVHIPSGEHISYMNKTSADGLCNLDVDMNAGGGRSKEPVENVFAGDLDAKKEAAHGKYKIVVQNYAYHGSPVGSEIPFRVVVSKNGEKEAFTGRCTGAGSKSNVTVTEFDYKGRTIPFPAEEEELAAFGTSNLVNMTASTGQTLDSLAQLVDAVFKLKHLDQARYLVNDDDNDDMEEEATYTHRAQRPLVAETGRLEVTSRDLLRLNLAKLPRAFHEMVWEEFGGGPTLAEECARQVSACMVADNIPVSELKRNGYPAEIVELVKQMMATDCGETQTTLLV